MQVRFDPATPDAWLVRTAGDRVLLLAAADERVVAQLGAALEGEDGFARVLDDLLRGGISTAPSFALLEFADGAARAVVRGPVRVIAEGDEVDGDGVATWVERPFPVDSLRVEAPGGAWSFAADGSAIRPAPTTAGELVGSPVEPTGPVEVPESTIEPSDESVPRHEYLFAPPTFDSPPATVPSPTSAPDHDGLTILAADLPERDASTSGDAVDSNGLPADADDPGEGDPGAGDPTAADPGARGDHDGSTVLASEVAGIATGAAPAPFSMTEAELSLELPDGRVEPLTQPVLLGRSPNLARSTGPLPKLLTVGADDPDISRTHARIAVEGGTVLVTDLGSRNGTSVVLPGRAPQRLREGEPTAVLVGTVIDLGGGVTLTVREE